MCRSIDGQCCRFDINIVQIGQPVVTSDQCSGGNDMYDVQSLYIRVEYHVSSYISSAKNGNNRI